LTPIVRKITNTPAYTSSTLAARSIEYLRATGDLDAPLNIVRKLLEVNGEDHAAEILCIILLLAGGSFAPTDRDEYLSLLINATIKLSDSTNISSADSSRRECLLGLVAIVFTAQPASSKLAVLNELVNQLDKVDITTSPTVRLALLSFTTDNDASIGVQIAFEKLCIRDRNKEVLARNFYSLRPSKGTIPQTWYMLDKAFGRSSSHSQQSEFGKLMQELSKSNNIKNSIPMLNRLSSLLAQCDEIYVEDTIGKNIKATLLKTQDLIEQALADIASTGKYIAEINSTFGDFTTSLHKTLVRFGDKADSPLIYNAFLELLQNQAEEHKLSFLKDVVPTRKALTLRWEEGIGDYFPLGEQISRLFSEIFSNISSKSVLLSPPSQNNEFDGLVEKAKAWIWFDQSLEPSRSGITIVVVTGVSSEKIVPQYKPKVTRLEDFGVRVTSSMVEKCYFEIRIRIPSLGSILEMR
jgi:hypothetical protein